MQDPCPSQISSMLQTRLSANILRFLIQEKMSLGILGVYEGDVGQVFQPVRRWSYRPDRLRKTCPTRLQLPRFTASAIAQAIRFGVAWELLLGRIPFHRSPQLVSNVAQVADDGRVDGQFDIAERLFARFDAMDEVTRRKCRLHLCS